MDLSEYMPCIEEGKDIPIFFAASAITAILAFTLL